MLQSIKTFFQNITDSEQPAQVLHSNKELAQAALMYHVIAVDGVIKDVEREHMLHVLENHFSLSQNESQALIDEAKRADQEAIDLYKFTSLLKRSFNEEERLTIVENLWEMVFADDILHEFEDNVLWRISELLGVNARQRLALKQKTWEKHSQTEGSS